VAVAVALTVVVTVTVRVLVGAFPTRVLVKVTTEAVAVEVLEMVLDALVAWSAQAEETIEAENEPKAGGV
jgi:hypothetical protein